MAVIAFEPATIRFTGASALHSIDGKGRVVALRSAVARCAASIGSRMRGGTRPGVTNGHSSTSDTVILATLQERVSRTRHEKEGMRRRHRHDLEVRLPMQGADFGDEEVQFAAAQLPQQVVPVPGQELHADSGKLLAEPAGGLGQHGLDRERAAPYGHPPRAQPAVGHRLAVELVRKPQQVPRALDVEPSQVGGDDPAARAQEELAAESTLEALDAARQGRLADVQCSGRAYEAAMFLERDDLAQLLEFEGHASSVYGECQICIGHIDAPGGTLRAGCVTQLQRDHAGFAESFHSRGENHMNRTHLRLASTALCAVLATFASIAQAQARKPNILVIWGDDIGGFNISAYNQGMMGYKTPNIDSIAREGALFTDWYGQQSCTAGRAAFITGQSPIRTGLTKVGLPGAPEGMKKEDPTIATLLKAQGYVTGQFGKNHLGDRDEMLPTAHGFDEFFGNLYHLNAEEEPENPDYFKNPALRKKFGPRGVIHSFADGRITDTGPLTKKRMETIDEEVTPRRSTSWRRRRRTASRSSSGGTPPACTSSRT